jgi:hypothetical protein
VCIQSKYLHKWKFWNISYIGSEPDDLGDYTKVAWEIDTQEAVLDSEKLGSTENKRKRILQTLGTLAISKEWHSAIEIANACGLGLDEKSIRRHMSTLCQENRASSCIISRALHYKLFTGQLSGQAKNA